MPTNTTTGIDLILDSGSTHHMIWNSLLLTEFVPNNDADRLNLGPVECGYGEQLRIMGYGNMRPLRRVLYVPGLTHNMISVKMLTFHGWSVTFINNKAAVTDLRTMSTIMVASVERGDLYRSTLGEKYKLNSATRICATASQ